MKLIFTMMLIVVLSAGCNLEFLYGLKELNDKYCSEVDENRRIELINKIREKHPEYPDGGECEIKQKIEKKLSDWIA